MSDMSDMSDPYQMPLTRVEEALFSSLEKCDLIGVRLALDIGANVNCVRPGAALVSTAINLAIGAGDRKLIETLLAYGADLHAVDVDGRHSVDHAVINSRNDLGILELLEKAGLEVNPQRIDTDRSALQIAAGAGFDNVCLFLLERGADVHARFSYGDILEGACGARGGLKTVLVLLEHGAVVTDRAIEAARCMGHTEVLDVLTAHESRRLAMEAIEAIDGIAQASAVDGLEHGSAPRGLERGFGP